MGMFIDFQHRGSKTGSTRQNHADFIDLALNDCIGGYRCAENDPVKIVNIFISQYRVGDFLESFYQVFVVCQNLGSLFYLIIIDDNCIRMRPSDINS